MQSVDIFESTKNQPKSRWASFPQVGDNVQGTYVGVREGVDSYDNEQFIYELLDRKNNEIINVGIKKTKIPVVKTMERVKLGQIIGFVREEDGKSKDGKSTFHKIEVKQDPKIVDREWLEEYAKYANLPSAVREQVATPASSLDAQFDAMAGQDDEPPFLTDEEYLKGIAEFARKKLGVTDPATVKDAVMEATDLPFIKSNYQEIYETLKSR